MKAAMKMQFLLAFLLFLSPFFFVHSAPLFGVDVNNMLFKTDSTNYDISPLSSQKIPYTLWQQSATFDSTNNLFYIVGLNISSSEFVLLGVNSNTGNIDTKFPLNLHNSANSVFNRGVLWDFSNVSQLLYITGNCADDTQQHCMLAVDPVSLDSKEIFRIGGQTNMMVSLSSFDSSRNVEFIVIGTATNTSAQVLIGVNVASGVIAYKMPFLDMYLFNMEYYEASRCLIGFAQMNTGGFALVQITVDDGKVTVIESFNVTRLLGSISAINQETGSLFLFLSNSTTPYPETQMQLNEIDLSSGQVIHSVQACTIAACPLSIVSPN